MFDITIIRENRNPLFLKVTEAVRENLGYTGGVQGLKEVLKKSFEEISSGNGGSADLSYRLKILNEWTNEEKLVVVHQEQIVVEIKKRKNG